MADASPTIDDIVAGIRAECLVFQAWCAAFMGWRSTSVSDNPTMMNLPVRRFASVMFPWKPGCCATG